MVLVKGGLAYANGEFTEADILIEEGRITGIGRGIRSDELPFDASGLVVLPGLIDPHVHLREPGAEKKEDFKTGSQAAIAGGFTTVIDMPNNPVPTITKAALTEKKKLAGQKAVCDVRFHFGATADNFDEVKSADPDSLKVYLGMTTGKMVIDRAAAKKHFERFDPAKPIVIHASDHSEDEEENLERTYSNEEFCIGAASRYNQRIHLAHASASHEITIFKRYGNASVEASPHHMFLNSSDAARLGALGTVYPQLRSEQKRLTLWKHLDQIDCIATDHAPHTIEDKDEGAHGFPGLETSLGLMLDACNRKLLGLEWVISRMSENPARIFNLHEKGRIAQGMEGSLTLVDLKKEWTVKREELFTKCRWSPWDGKKLKGQVHSVIYKGNLIFEQGEFL